MGLKEARKKAGLTQKEAATELGITGAAICQWEKEQTSPRSATLPKIASLYKCTVDELLRKETT